MSVDSTETTAAPFLVTSGAWQNLPKMPESEYPGTQGFIGDVYENLESMEQIMMSTEEVGDRTTERVRTVAAVPRVGICRPPP